MHVVLLNHVVPFIYLPPRMEVEKLRTNVNERLIVCSTEKLNQRRCSEQRVFESIDTPERFMKWLFYDFNGNVNQEIGLLLRIQERLRER